MARTTLFRLQTSLIALVLFAWSGVAWSGFVPAAHLVLDRSYSIGIT